MSGFVADVRPRSRESIYVDEGMDSDSDDFVAELSPRSQSRRPLSDREPGGNHQRAKEAPSDSDVLKMLSGRNFSRNDVSSLLKNSILELIEKVLTGRCLAKIQGQIQITFQNKENEDPLTLDLEKQLGPSSDKDVSSNEDALGLNLKLKQTPRVVIEKAEADPECQLTPSIYENKKDQLRRFLDIDMPYTHSHRLDPSRFSDNDSDFITRDCYDRDRLSPASVSSLETTKRMSPSILSPVSDYHCTSRMDSLFEGLLRQKRESSCEKNVLGHRSSISDASDGSSIRGDDDNNDIEDGLSPLVIDENAPAEVKGTSSPEDHSADEAESQKPGSNLPHPAEKVVENTENTRAANIVADKADLNRPDEEVESPMDLSGDSKRPWDNTFNRQDSCEGSYDANRTPSCQNGSQGFESEHARNGRYLQQPGAPYEGTSLGKTESDEGYLLDLSVNKQSVDRSLDSCSLQRRGPQGSTSSISRNGYVPQDLHLNLQLEAEAGEFRSEEKTYSQVYNMQSASGQCLPFSQQIEGLHDPLKSHVVGSCLISHPIKSESIEETGQDEKCRLSHPCMTRPGCKCCDKKPIAGPFRFHPFSRERLADIAAKYMASRSSYVNPKYAKLREKIRCSEGFQKFKSTKLGLNLKTIDCQRKMMQGTTSTLKSDLDSGSEQRVDASSETTLKTRLPVFIKSENLQENEADVSAFRCSHSNGSLTPTSRKISGATKSNSHSTEICSKYRVCEICKEEFSSFHDLEGHSVTVHQKYLCEHCGKSFTARPNRDRHVRFHTGERPYKCDLCNSAFTRGDDLKYHRTTRHPDAQPFVCPQCNATFTWSRDLERHIRHSKCKMQN